MKRFLLAVMLMLPMAACTAYTGTVQVWDYGNNTGALYFGCALDSFQTETEETGVNYLVATCTSEETAVIDRPAPPVGTNGYTVMDVVHLYSPKGSTEYNSVCRIRYVQFNLDSYQINVDCTNVCLTADKPRRRG